MMKKMRRFLMPNMVGSGTELQFIIYQRHIPEWHEVFIPLAEEEEEEEASAQESATLQVQVAAHLLLILLRCTS